MKRILLITAVVLLSGCASVQNWIPSFWDDNQSAKITDVRLTVDRIDCAKDQLAQAQQLRDQLRWFELYSVSKGALQKDVIRLIAPIQETTEDWYKRSLDGQGSVGYCNIKKKILEQQTARAAKGILGRW
jgi:outer membrane murein-binding lipoprotein Lpp